MALKLTPEEVERYRPYHLWPAFEFGFNDYNDYRDRHFDPGTPAGQAYDRGAECAMERGRPANRQTGA
jgi:hypothetical protein